ncbi:hypothetical protein Zmor_007020 [Zophobas morio]|uniref:Uncharacterized protein n=1 Tax=Zophobas morio TaxID=2755281 RepID=A0AA38ISY1_9CUCU|nr:hypothetical protein Zmor_007020 [Zophobas morio]
MSSSMYGDDDPLSVTPDGEKPGSRCRDGCSRTTLEAVTETSRRTARLFKWEPPSGVGSEDQAMGESGQIHSSRNYSVHNRCVISRVNLSY